MSTSFVSYGAHPLGLESKRPNPRWPRGRIGSLSGETARFDLQRMLTGGHEIHVWQRKLDPRALNIRALRQSLSPEERSRAADFRHDRDRHRFVLRHAFLREVLATYLDLRPGQISLISALHQKPRLVENVHGSDLQFSLSISEDQVVVAVAWQRQVGIDIERIRADFDSLEIAANVLSNAEAVDFQMAPASAQTALFFRIWTRKEAVVKAMGFGLQRDLRSLDVVEPGDHSMRKEHALIIDGKADEEPISWQVRDLRIRSGFASACCAEGSGWTAVNVGHDH